MHVVVSIYPSGQKQSAENERSDQKYDHADQPHRIGRAASVLPKRKRGEK